MNKSNGGPAFPRDTKWNADGTTCQDGSRGMSLRDWFAGQALAGSLGNPESAIISERLMAKVCYDYADAMLADRNKE